MNEILQDREDTAVGKSELGKKAAIFITVILLLALSVFSYWSLQSDNILVIKNDKNEHGVVVGVPIRPPEVQANGGIIILTVDFCKTKQLTGTTELALIGESGGSKIAVAWPPDNTGETCQKIDVPVAIPAQTPTDTYHLVYDIHYQINPIKSAHITFKSQSFKVVNQKLQPGDAKPQP